MRDRAPNFYLVRRLPGRGRPPPAKPIRFGQWHEAPAQDAPHPPEPDARQRHGVVALHVLRAIMFLTVLVVLIGGGLLAWRLTLGR